MKNISMTGSKRRSECTHIQHITKNTGASINIQANLLEIATPHEAVRKIPYPAFTK